jgi:poly-gamma-glutamate capsule biosynthesis protein CapA/YwtB (metallophosphatase superfamily)
MVRARTASRWWLLPNIVAVVVLAACRSGGGSEVRIEPWTAPGTPAPSVRAAAADQPVRVAVPDGLRDLVEPLLDASGAATAVRAHLVPEQADADIRLTISHRTSDDPVVRRWSVVTAAARIDLDGVGMAAVEQAARDSRLFAAAEHHGPAASVYGGPGTVMPVPGDLLPSRLAETPDSFALVPADTVTVRVRALALDGVDPVRGEGDLSAYPFVTRARVSLVSGGAAAQEVLARVEDGLLQVDRPPIRITFTGDLIPARCVYDQMRRLGDWMAPFRVMGERLRSADLTVGSLDAAISAAGTPIGCRETYSLLAPPAVLQGFQAAGFDLLAVATNHIKDCGASGPCGDTTFRDTLTLLRAAGIEPVGGGENRAEARRPVVRTAGGLRFAFLAYDDVARYYHATESSPGTAPLDDETLAADIDAARAVADVVIVLPQWGEEYTPNPTPRQQRVAARAIESGAAMVVGNHPHVVQAATPHGDGYVAYALGNFLFDQDWSRETMEGVLLETTFHGARLAAVRFVPYRIENRLQPVPAQGDDALRVLGRMIAAAAALR